MPICQYVDIGNSPSMPLCRADMPIYRYIDIIGKKVNADIPISAFRQVCRYVSMCRNVDMTISAIRQLCYYAVIIC